MATKRPPESPQATAQNPSAFERANYMETLRSWVTPQELTAASPSRAADRRGED